MEVLPFYQSLLNITIETFFIISSKSSVLGIRNQVSSVAGAYSKADEGGIEGSSGPIIGDNR
jgi:hypothetical protein